MKKTGSITLTPYEPVLLRAGISGAQPAEVKNVSSNITGDTTAVITWKPDDEDFYIGRKYLFCFE